ncbi:hypothetical protein E2C01_087566 [Portunus trituberculatus]|uniref:Uncharacterized protein n=1 Tax=Portunus trituberculatus TaxID=210409 RepID=A0A5B7JCU2_PORTR|nr:hypothetical protein [Portunus trituberculatus]
MFASRNHNSRKIKAQTCIAPTKIHIKRNNKNDTIGRDRSKALLSPHLHLSSLEELREGPIRTKEDEGLPLKII